MTMATCTIYAVYFCHSFNDNIERNTLPQDDGIVQSVSAVCAL